MGNNTHELIIATQQSQLLTRDASGEAPRRRLTVRQGLPWSRRSRVRLRPRKRHYRHERMLLRRAAAEQAELNAGHVSIARHASIERRLQSSSGGRSAIAGFNMRKYRAQRVQHRVWKRGPRECCRSSAQPELSLPEFANSWGSGDARSGLAVAVIHWKGSPHPHLVLRSPREDKCFRSCTEIDCRFCTAEF